VNQRRKRDGWGLKTYAARDAAEWIRLEAPELRIVSDQTWGDAQARLDGAKAAYLRGTRGRLEGRPANGIESKYLLTGLLQCGGCGAALTVMSGDWKTHRAPCVRVLV